MSQTKEEIEQELLDFKNANPGWMNNKDYRSFVASYNIRFAS
jgi:hypothetical protein